MLAATLALATDNDKFVSTEYGFAASFPAGAVRTENASNAASFVVGAPGDAWVAEVKAIKNVAMPQHLDKEFMEAKLAEILRSGGMTQTGTNSYTTLQGCPALLATATFYYNSLPNREAQNVVYPVAADLKLIFVRSQNLVKGQNRLYWVAGWAIQGKDRSAIQPFLDSFELR